MSIQWLSCVLFLCLLVVALGHSRSQDMAEPQTEGTLGPCVTQQEPRWAQDYLSQHLSGLALTNN